MFRSGKPYGWFRESQPVDKPVEAVKPPPRVDYVNGVQLNTTGLMPGTQIAPRVKAGSRIGKKFGRCVKSVRKTVKARKGSTAEAAAIAICTKSVLQTRGKTLKRYRKGKLTTQKKFRGGSRCY